MKIVRIKDIYDTNCWNTYPPSLEDVSEKEKFWIKRLHKLFYGSNWYVEDPLSGSQVMYIQFKDIPFSWIYQFFFVKTEIIYNQRL